DLLLHPLRALVAALVRVPVAEWNVLGRHLHVAGAGFNKTPRQQASLAESAGVVRLVHGPRLERQIERLRRRRRQQTIGGVERPYQRLALEVAGVLVGGLLREQSLVELTTAQKALFAERGGRPDRGGGILRVRNQKRSVLGAEEAGR